MLLQRSLSNKTAHISALQMANNKLPFLLYQTNMQYSQFRYIENAPEDQSLEWMKQNEQQNIVELDAVREDNIKLINDEILQNINEEIKYDCKKNKTTKQAMKKRKKRKTGADINIRYK